jgi:hypothetical protein
MKFEEVEEIQLLFIDEVPGMFLVSSASGAGNFPPMM